MKIGLMSSLVALAMIGGAGAAWAQPAGSASERQAPTKQSAPPESPQAAGHDAQSGHPETGPNATQAQNPSTQHDVDETKSKSNSPPGRK